MAWSVGLLSPRVTFTWKAIIVDSKNGWFIYSRGFVDLVDSIHATVHQAVILCLIKTNLDIGYGNQHRLA